MDEELIISLRNVSKCFKRYIRPVDRLKELLLPEAGWAEEFWALQNINLDISKGQTVGIIGQNGSGKSTLLQIIAKTLVPTLGEVHVKGRVSALLELGSGFNPEFTGRQNVFFNGKLLGLSQREIEDKFDEIASFADIGNFLDEPVKTYSSGMFVRLAFAVAINVDPEILIVDEALSVGDGIFVHRCMAKIKSFQDSGKTILFVSHDIGAITRLCSQVVWIDHGNIIEVGNPEEISRHYQAWTYDQINDYQKNHNEISHTLADTKQYKEYSCETAVNSNHSSNIRINPVNNQPYKSFHNIDRFGTGRAEIIDFTVLDPRNEQVELVYPNDPVRLVVKILSHDYVQRPIVGIMLYDRLRTAISGFNTYQYNHPLATLFPDQFMTVEFSLNWPEIQGGNYVLEPAIADGSQESHEMLDWLQLPLNIISGVTDLTFGVFRTASVNIRHYVCQDQSFLKNCQKTGLSETV